MYELKFLKSAEHYFKKIREKGLQEAFTLSLENLSTNPYLEEEKRGDLAGIYCYDVFYNKTNYEIAYRIYENNNRAIVVIMAGTRENFYKELKRYMK